jgi:predicted RNase H-like nuclease (RuvC/YqgF family)
MRQLALLLCGIFFAGVNASYGQSLGDVARQQRQKQQSRDAKTPAKKVITNEDIPEHPESPSDSSASATNSDDKPAHSSRPAVDAHSAEEWKAAIQAQKQNIANLQSQIDKLNSSIHFVQSNLYYNGAEYNQHQQKKQEQVQQMQKQLEEAKKKLEDMQESARKAGFGSAFYEP